LVPAHRGKPAPSASAFVVGRATACNSAAGAPPKKHCLLLRDRRRWLQAVAHDEQTGLSNELALSIEQAITILRDLILRLG
jgi:hypothetical protein